MAFEVVKLMIETAKQISTVMWFEFYRRLTFFLSFSFRRRFFLFFFSAIFFFFLFLSVGFFFSLRFIFLLFSLCDLSSIIRFSSNAQKEKYKLVY